MDIVHIAFKEITLMNISARTRTARHYDGIQVSSRRADVVVEHQVVTELKAVVQLEDVHLAQAKTYCILWLPL
jgi:GxxExxY protein